LRIAWVFPFSFSLFRQTPQFIRQNIWKKRQGMSENARISLPFLVYLLVRKREKELPAFSLIQRKTAMRMIPKAFYIWSQQTHTMFLSQVGALSR
jgi:hypothetical protein